MNNPDVTENRKVRTRPLQEVVLWPGWFALGLWITLGIVGKLVDGKDIPWSTYASQCWGATIFVLAMKASRALRRIKQNTPMSKANQSEKAQLLQKLSDAAKASRTRVSAYSDEQRSRLEEFARGVIQGAKTKQICRS